MTTRVRARLGAARPVQAWQIRAGRVMASLSRMAGLGPAWLGPACLVGHGTAIPVASRLGQARPRTASRNAARQDPARLGLSGPGLARFGRARQVRQVTPPHTATRCGSAGRGVAWLGAVRPGSSRLGNPCRGSARLPVPRLGEASPGAARQVGARLGPGLAWRGSASLRGTSRRVQARFGPARPGTASLLWSRLGASRRGGTWFGETRFGMAPRGLSGLGRAWRGTARLGAARMGLA